MRRTTRSGAMALPSAVAAAIVLAGCGATADSRTDPRPPAPIVLTASISDQRVSVSPRSFGAGPISLIVTNQTETAQRVIVMYAGRVVESAPVAWRNSDSTDSVAAGTPKNGTNAFW